MDGLVDLTALERELCRIPEVTAARIVAGASGDIEEVHILSLPSKHAKQVVRDIQSVAMATFNLELDRRVVSVVQLDTPHAIADADAHDEDGSTLDAPRITVEAVSAVRGGIRCSAEVALRLGDERAIGSAEGLVAPTTVLRLVAQATLDALRHLEPAAARADVEAATMVNVGSRVVALATVVIVAPPYEEVSSGSAVVRSAGDLDAVARAVLDATNRRLKQLR